MSELKFKGTARAKLKYDDGREEIVEQGNMIVNSGFDLIISSLISSSNRPNTLSHVAIGTGDTVSSSSMTALVNETHRGFGTWSWSAGSKVFTISTTYPKGSVLDLIAEGGVFNASIGGTMFDRVVFTSPVQGTADMTYTQEFEFEVL